MKQISRFLRSTALLTIAFCGASALATTFNTDTTIGVTNTFFDGANIVVTNATLTIDGPHAFASLSILNGAVLTHTAVPSGSFSFSQTVTGEVHVISQTNPVTLNLSNVVAASVVVSDQTGTNIYVDNSDYVVSQLGAVTEIELTTNTTIVDGSTILVNYSTVTVVQSGLNLAISGTVSVAAGGAINANGRGYGGAMGPAPGRTSLNYPPDGGGGGHAGDGGMSSSNAPGGGPYDSALNPVDKGSGGGMATGGPGGAGGGAINITAGGMIKIDGIVSADGFNATNSRSGGGAGGSVLLTAPVIAGAGLVSSSGGDGEPIHGGGGGGGYVALYFGSNWFTGSLVATGGVGFVAGGAGIVYTRNTSQLAGQVVIDNGGKKGTNTTFNVAEAVALTVSGGARAVLFNKNLASLLVSSNSFLVGSSGSGAALSATVQGDATIQSGGGIMNLSTGSLGLGTGSNTNNGTIYAGGGGGYGGPGGTSGTGAAGGGAYGSLTEPDTDGGRGGIANGPPIAPGQPGIGGGTIALTVNGTFELDGAITANGTAGAALNTGGGAGGSIILTIANFAGAGSITANGGAGNHLGGGGGGGRISITCRATNLFSGTVTAYGGPGASPGGAGTIYTQNPNPLSPGLAPLNAILVDNDGQSGPSTSLGSPPAISADLTLTGAANAIWPAFTSLQVRDLLITSNSTLLVSNGSSSINIPVSSNAVILAGGRISLDGQGFTSPGFLGQVGEGPGRPATAPGLGAGGGGHGGVGGSATNTSAGGISYDTSIGPIMLGSPGGNPYPGINLPGAGGRGGGALRLGVNGLLQLDGQISANGSAGGGTNAGGGSGGSIWISTGTLAGGGSISANGGSGSAPLGGGGAGGRIAITSGTNLYTGQITAYGGAGGGIGGAGTIFISSTRSQTGVIIADNGGQSGTNTTLGTLQPSGMSLTVQGGAVLTPANLQNVVNILVASNSVLLYTNMTSQVTLSVISNVVVQAGGAIIVDGAGNVPGKGPGAGFDGTGGGYGGFGGAGQPPSSGGGTYGNTLQPIDLGSGGGYYSSPTLPTSGAGGGSLRLNINGNLQLDGRISANGLAGVPVNGVTGTTPGSGGGSGGSLYLQIGRQFTGGGVISANGGAGAGVSGGGGGGGRIAITPNPAALILYSNGFRGTVTAYGGSGAKIGGAGTIFWQSGGQGQGQILVNNGGQFGTNTTFGNSQNSGYDVTVSQGGILSSPTSGTSLGTFNTLTVGSNGVVQFPTSTAGQQFTLIVNSNLVVQAGGAIIADGAGYPAGSGPGLGQMATNPTNAAGGGGYGGFGGSGTGGNGGASYGTPMSPVNPGSGGGTPYLGLGTNGGGNGGGALRIMVNKSLQVDGRISANGFAGSVTNTGGGAGGSLWITVASGFAGAGIISANGAPGGSPNAGGGGGGRISITYNNNNTAGTNMNFVGTLSAYGGAGLIRGGAGTIYLAGNPANQGPARLIVDNGGTPGAGTTLGSGAPTTVTLALSGGGTLVMPTQVTITSLNIGSGSTLLFTNIGSTLNVNGSATIQPGGAISGSANASSFSRSSTGNGGVSSLPPIGLTTGGGGGGGYGGFGSAGTVSTTPIGGTARPGYGGASFGSSLEPLSEGGSGAPLSQTPSEPGGGVGGFPVQITVTGTFTNNGRISSDGANGNTANSGGGAGGGILIRAGGFVGNGVVSANGGAGKGLGGSGGGGRIAIFNGYYTYGPGVTTNVFTGTITAYGGGNTNFGGAGTIYMSPGPTKQIAQILVDNGGHLGTNTLFIDAGTFDLVAQNGGAVLPPPNSTLHNLLVGSNGWIIVSNQTINVSGAVDVQAGGGIIADGRGFGGGQGPGVGANVGIAGQGGGGGGFGGNGAPDLNGPAGGQAYGFTSTPIQMGSGGGAAVGALIGSNAGAGGGIVNIQMPQGVPGTLTVDGIISANGAPNNATPAGAGSGGCIFLNVKSLSGAGAISADGGSAFGTGGGGGGGRIFIVTATNQFAGVTHAYGGTGATGAGGAGTLDITSASPVQSDLIVDNGGQTGAATPVTAYFPRVSAVALPSFAVGNITIADGAMGYPNDPYLAVSNLTIGDGGLLVGSPQGTNLQVLVYSNLEVSVDGAIAVDAQGYSEANGPGAGTNSSGDGSGGGYGGMGGDSLSGAFGGSSYGSATQPIDRGSGGGAGSGPLYTGGSEGGGALRIDVAGTLNVDGSISANGNPGFQDNSGGGSGGSIWITASKVTGSGMISAEGGEGELYGGGGGAGGRVAIYQPNHGYHTNTFLGLASAFGADGAFFGDDGTVLFADVSAPQVVSQSPSGIVSNFVSTIDFQFSSAIDQSSLSTSSLTLVAPSGATQSVFTVSMTALGLVRFSIPLQMDNGTYSLTLAQVRNLYGQTMVHPYSGNFTIALPTISGRITDTNGLPLAGVPIAPNIAVASQTQTDSNGLYTITVIPGSTITVAPYWPYAPLQFAPANRTYSNFTTSIANENYVAYTGIAPAVASGIQDTNFMVNWMGLQGVTYQLYSSTNMVDWFPYGPPINGSNSVIQVPVPPVGGPQQFFRVQANQ